MSRISVAFPKDLDVCGGNPVWVNSALKLTAQPLTHRDEKRVTEDRDHGATRHLAQVATVLNRCSRAYNNSILSMPSDGDEA